MPISDTKGFSLFFMVTRPFDKFAWYCDILLVVYVPYFLRCCLDEQASGYETWEVRSEVRSDRLTI
jgi:hypothetical protein